MASQINLTVDVELNTKTTLDAKQRRQLIADMKHEIKTYIELRICDLAPKHQTLFDPYELQIFIEEVK